MFLNLCKGGLCLNENQNGTLCCVTCISNSFHLKAKVYLPLNTSVYSSFPRSPNRRLFQKKPGSNIRFLISDFSIKLNSTINSWSFVYYFFYLLALTALWFDNINKENGVEYTIRLRHEVLPSNSWFTDSSVPRLILAGPRVSPK